VRVARGPRLKSLYAPAAGYRYDGLYFVEDYWEDTGKAGFKIWRYRFRRDDPERPSWEPAPMLPEQAESGRRETTIQRIIRNTAVAMGVKELHGYCCQVCGVSLQFAGGLYAEGHISDLWGGRITGRMSLKTFSASARIITSCSMMARSAWPMISR
jgi:putative restriction endonuclease